MGSRSTSRRISPRSTEWSRAASCTRSLRLHVLVSTLAWMKSHRVSRNPSHGGSTGTSGGPTSVPRSRERSPKTHRCAPQKTSRWPFSRPEDASSLGRGRTRAPTTRDHRVRGRAPNALWSAAQQSLTLYVVGLMFIGALVRKRSLASAALLFLLLVDEIEGLCFTAVAVVLQRPELFMSMQDVIFPAVLSVAGVVALVSNWRLPEPAPVEEPIEAVEAGVLTQRIGAR